jgi:hypothetical protein
MIGAGVSGSKKKDLRNRSFDGSRAAVVWVTVGAALLLVLSIVAIQVPTRAEEPAAWQSTTASPLAQSSCVAHSGYVYCVGGTPRACFDQPSPCDPSNPYTNEVVYAPLTSSGIGQWKNTTQYPVRASPYCVTDGGYIYCLGGATGGFGTGTRLSYYAPVSSSGVGTWTKATNSTAGHYDSCTVDSGTVYCISGVFGSFSVSYAPLSVSGIGQWTVKDFNVGNYQYGVQSTGFLDNCVMSSSYLYCMGAGNATTHTENTPWFFASISASGPGTWTETRDYLVNQSNVGSIACETNSDYVYCVGGNGQATNNFPYGAPSSAVYFAQLAGSGIGAWTQGPNYPVGIFGASCLVDSNTIYCISGQSAAADGSAVIAGSYYTSIAAPRASSSSTSSSRSPASSSSSSTSRSASATVASASTTSSSSSGGGGGGVPEFPYQLTAAAAFTLLLLASYVLVRRGTRTRSPPVGLGT